MEGSTVREGPEEEGLLDEDEEPELLPGAEEPELGDPVLLPDPEKPPDVEGFVKEGPEDDPNGAPDDDPEFPPNPCTKIGTNTLVVVVTVVPPETPETPVAEDEDPVVVVLLEPDSELTVLEDPPTVDVDIGTADPDEEEPKIVPVDEPSDGNVPVDDGVPITGDKEEPSEEKLPPEDDDADPEEPDRGAAVPQDCWLFPKGSKIPTLGLYEAGKLP